MRVSVRASGFIRRAGVLVSVLLCAALAGCVTTASNKLTPDDVATLKLTSVNISVAPDAIIQWEDGVRAYGSAKALADDQLAMAAQTPEAKAFIGNALATRIKPAFEKQLLGKLTGHRPVRLNIVVHEFVVTSAVQRILIGGGHHMVADAVLVDARTGATIVEYPNLRGIAFAGNGVLGTAIDAAVAGDPTERVVNGYSERYHDWLNHKT
jgi:hypothetical protein